MVVSSHFVTFRPKHIFLTFGLISFLISPLFSATAFCLFTLLSIGGLLFSLFFLLFVLLTPGTVKSKILWTLICIFSFTLLILIRGQLSKYSHVMFVTQNRETLMKVNEILKKKSGNISISKHSTVNSDFLLSASEVKILLDACHKLQTNFIIKGSKNTYFELSGFLDNRDGVTYWPDSIPPSRYTHLTDKWYW
jgi:hypothetical protein